MDLDFFETAAELVRRGEPFVTATVVSAGRPTSGKPGDKAVVTPDGRIWGWIGGSCSQPTVVREARRALADGRPRLVRLTPEVEEAASEGGPTPEPDAVPDLDANRVDHPMTCFSGGRLEIFLEPHSPRPALLVYGDSPVARALVPLAEAMRWRVARIDLDAEPAASIDLPADTPTVVASHGLYDEDALGRALDRGAPWVGLVSSRRRFGDVRATLAARGRDEAELGRIVAPAGLDLGAKEPEEVALSILAEVVQWRRAEAAVAPAEPEAAEEPETAVDPVCGMTVQVEGARHTAVHDGVPYYFCCAGCQTSFEGDPARYL